MCCGRSAGDSEEDRHIVHEDDFSVVVEDESHKSKHEGWRRWGEIPLEVLYYAHFQVHGFILETNQRMFTHCPLLQRRHSSSV